ncbi:hypothetical protein [Caulobacter sp. DWP3-1-3b2]|uniref:hypothetical protein n=1 Tax=Caulobacter sp. DWP3-1-3b2 TaxID=2804643 RepID=UPI003CEDA1B3
MALQESVRLYEVLIRFPPDGTPSALQRQIEEVIRDGEVIHATGRLAEPIDPDAVNGLIEASLAQLLAENLKLRALLSPEQRRDHGLET